MQKPSDIVIYQAKDGAIELKKDIKNETIWANRMQMAEIFNVNPQAISKHIIKIYDDGELEKKSTSSKMELVQNESGRIVKRQVDYYNLEVLISVGYRINSVKGTKFRQWATKILKQHITQGFTIDPKRIKQNHRSFLKAVENIKLLVKNNVCVSTDDVLELIKTFSYTWFSLQSYDQVVFPQKTTKSAIKVTATELQKDLQVFKENLIQKNEATDLFAQRRQSQHHA